jgi:hypothetical protein
MKLKTSILEVYNMLTPNNDKNLFITKQINELTKSVKLDVELDDNEMYNKTLPILNLLPNRNFNIEREGIVSFSNIWKKNNHIVEYTFFGVILDYVVTYDIRINMVEGTFTHKDRNEGNNPTSSIERDNLFKGYGYENGFSDFVKESFLVTLRTIIFIELSKEKVRLVDIKPKEKHGNFLKGTEIKNQTKITITKVDSLWNVKSICVGEFKVRGHFRLQKCGIGLSEVKLIYIDEFVKTQYIRKSTRDLVLG